MKRLTIACVVLTSVILAGCNRAAQEVPPNVLATQVAATLTAAPTLPSSITPPPSPTTLPSATQAVPPTETPTETPTPGGSPSPTPPPLAPDDPRTGLNLAAPEYTDNFSVAYKWVGPEDSNSATNQMGSERLTATDHKADGYIWWSTTDQQAGDSYAEVSATIGACSGKDAAGFSVRVNGANFDQAYALDFSCDGSFRIRKFITEVAPGVLTEWTTSPEITKGPNVTNRMGLLAKGSKLYVFANGKLIGQVEDTSYASGTFGLYASAVDTAPLTVTFDDFAVWYP
jgi:hypothetical protein